MDKQSNKNKKKKEQKRLSEPVTNCDQSNELITNCDQLNDTEEITPMEEMDIANLIVVVRGQQVLIDRDIAMLESRGRFYRSFLITRTDPTKCRSKDIIGNSGTVVTITVTADKDMKAGDLTGYFRKIKLANANDANIRATYDEMSFPISVASLPLGDANVSGNVDATDIVDIVNYLMGKPSSTGAFNEDLADANEDGVVDTADIVSIVNIIMNK